MENKPTMTKLDGRLRALARHGGFAGEARAFDRKCRAWLREDGNRDGRGARADAIGQAFKGCRQFEKALRAQDHGDSTVRREACKVVRSARHWDFPELLKRLSALWGQVSLGTGDDLQQFAQLDPELLHLTLSLLFRYDP